MSNQYGGPGRKEKLPPSFEEDRAARQIALEAFADWEATQGCPKCRNPLVEERESSSTGYVRLKRCWICGSRLFAPDLPVGPTLQDTVEIKPTRAQKAGDPWTDPRICAYERVSERRKRIIKRLHQQQEPISIISRRTRLPHSVIRQILAEPPLQEKRDGASS